MTGIRPLVASSGVPRAAAVAVHVAPAAAQDADGPLEGGVLHGLSGTMAISETALKDTIEMRVGLQNEAGGGLGCEIAPVVVGPPPTGRSLPRRRASC